MEVLGRNAVRASVKTPRVVKKITRFALMSSRGEQVPKLKSARKQNHLWQCLDTDLSTNMLVDQMKIIMRRQCGWNISVNKENKVNSNLCGSPDNFEFIMTVTDALEQGLDTLVLFHSFKPMRTEQDAVKDIHQIQAMLNRIRPDFHNHVRVFVAEMVMPLESSPVPQDVTQPIFCMQQFRSLQRMNNHVKNYLPQGMAYLPFNFASVSTLSPSSPNALKLAKINMKFYLDIVPSN